MYIDIKAENTTEHAQKVSFSFSSQIVSKYIDVDMYVNAEIYFKRKTSYKHERETKNKTFNITVTS